MYAEHGSSPTVRLKRELWSKLLRTAFGTQFTDDDDLFLEHTLLVNTAEIIAHLVLGFEVTGIAPATLLRGQLFERAQVYGVVEQDFFDWVLEIPGGEPFIRTLARKLRRFAWENVEHDVLKALYESIISADTRKRLGEYYTPDWLAEQIVTTIVTQPLQQRVLDPACGSGTFLFHAVRRRLAAADEAGIPISQSLNTLANGVIGIDLHPVAVALARVTYLLAIGRERLVNPQRGPVTIPVYLGDSIQWQQRTDLLSEGHLVVPTGEGGMLLQDELRFPESLLNDAGRFDRLIDEMATLAVRPRSSGRPPSPTAIFNRLAIADEDRPGLSETFAVLCRLHDEGRDHIWSYYVRNLARPMWLSLPQNRVDILLGNPPWLSYRHMTGEMQRTFQDMSRSRGLWQGSSVATQQDLSGLFVARTVQQYLAASGALAFVMPNAALDRGYFAGFRTGIYGDAMEPAYVSFTGSWDLRRLRPHFFPRGSCVVFGQRTVRNPSPLPRETERWTGHLPRGDETWASAAPFVTREPANLVQSTEAIVGSLYEQRFRNGATIYPRLFFLVDEQEKSPLGWGSGRRAVRSSRSSTENDPWKNLPRQEGIVETEFIRSVILGESVLPYRLLPPRLAVLPLDGRNLVTDQNLDMYPGLADWWRTANETWLANRSSERLTLAEQLDYHHKLTEQVPGSALRVVYAKAGMHVVASLVRMPDVIVDHKLYWGTVASEEEGMYLCAILNNAALTELARPLMSYGKDERDIDKHLWKLPIPLYDSTNPGHAQLAHLGREQSEIVAGIDIDESGYFVTLRRRIREILNNSRPSQEAAPLIEELLG